MKIRKGQKRLTKAQEAYLKRFAKRQIEKYLSTKQVLSDKQIELCVRNAYKVGGQKAPKVRWFKSPEAFCKTVRDSIGDSVWGSVWGSVRGSVWDSVRDSVGAWDDSGWLSFYRLFNNTLKENDLIWLSKVSENVTGYGLYEKECWLVRKPTVLTRDEQGRLHNETGMAVKWSDGVGYYFWHGIRATKKIIETPNKLTKRDWEKEENLEVRRIIQERMGDRFVKALKAKSISKDEFGELLEIDLKDDPEKIARYVRLKDSSTARIYYLRIPPTIETARAGVSWSFNIDEKDYNLAQET